MSELSSEQNTNMFLNGWLPGVFIKTAAPIILIMTINGLFVVVDAYFLGVYVGAEALSAVTLIFPLFTLLVALQSLVSNGMASILARELGAGERQEGNRTFTGAHALCLVTVVILYVLFIAFGATAIRDVSGGSENVAHYATVFMGITIGFAPIGFFLSLNIDALRCEGRLGFMAIVTVAATLLNMVFNWLLMAIFHWGVAGSAFGSVFAQVFCLLAILVFRWRNRDAVRFDFHRLTEKWGQILALGAPMSLGFIGISLGSAATIASVNLWQSENYGATIAAYGITTRLFTFAYLPLMAISMATQTISGNNFGAHLLERTGQTLRIALVLGLCYCGILELVMVFGAGPLGAIFVDDPAIIKETARILPLMALFYILVAPVVILSGYFQALGDARRATILGLTKSYVLLIPATFILPQMLGEPGIWYANPVADGSMFAITVIVLIINARKAHWSWGMFPVEAQVRAT